MLMSLMRKHAKSWLIKFLIGMIAVVFIFYFGYSFHSREGLKVASVNGEPVSGMEYQKAYRNLLERLQKEYANAWNENLVQAFDLKNKALESIISQKLMSQEAKRIGLDVTEKEIQEEILAFPAFQFRGHFDESRYRSLLQQNRMKPEDFEAGVAQDLLDRKLGQFLTSFSPVTDQEVRDHYRYFNRKVKVGFVRFDAGDFKESVQVDPKAMEAFFEAHREDYRIPPKIAIAYIVLDPADFREGVSVEEQQIKDYYEENIERFREQKQVKARHILFKLAEDATEEETEKTSERAKTVLESARAGEDFAALAEEYSEGPTKEKGGDLGYFASGQMVKPFEEAAFAMKPGDLSDLVRTPFGFHIIKVEDVKEAGTKALEEVREEIAETFAGSASADLAHEKALTLLDQMPYDVDLPQYAAGQGVPVKRFGPFAEDEAIEEIEGDRKFRESLFSYEEGDVSDVVEQGGKFYIVQVTEKKPSALPGLKDVMDKVEAAFKSHLALEEAKAKAEEYLAQLKQGQDWESLATANDMEPGLTDFFTRRDNVPQLGYGPDLKEAAFGLSDDKRYPDGVFVSDGGVFVIRWEAQEDIDEKKFAEEREGFEHSLMRVKQQAAYRDWLEELRSRAEIEILSPLAAD